MADYIEREAARQCIHKWLADIFGIDEPELTVLDKRLNAIPAADVVPVMHGRWIDYQYKGGRRPTVIRYCSICGHNNNNRKTNFCPNCGAIMDKDGDGDV